MSVISGEKWRTALTSMLEELDRNQYRKMLESLEKVRKGQKTGITKEKMPQKIIECYGLEGSISAVRDAMDEIPRRDPAVQDLLRPFVDKLGKKYEKKNKGLTQRRRLKASATSCEAANCSPCRGEAGHGSCQRSGLFLSTDRNDSVSKPQSSVTTCGSKLQSPGQKRKRDGVEEEEEQGKKPAAGREKSRQPDKATDTRPWMKSIADLKSSSELLDTHGVVGKVIQKSSLRQYETKDGVKKDFFYLVVADEKDSIKMMVYGKPHHKQIKEDKSYLFRNLRRDERSVKVTTLSKVSETRPVEVPEELEAEARKLMYSESPVLSIAEAKTSDGGTEVTVEGTVTEIDPSELVKVQRQLKKMKRQGFQLNDDKDSIRIYMWGEHTKQCKGLSVGDVIKVTNAKTSRYCDTVSLTSTGYTQIQKVHSVGVQNARIEIIAIKKSTKKDTHLDAEFDGQVHTFVVGSGLLAKACGLKVEGDLKESLLQKVPLLADAVIRGNKITKLTVA